MIHAGGHGDAVLLCCRPGRARARPGIHTPQFLDIAAAYGSPLEPVLAQAGTGTTCWRAAISPRERFGAAVVPGERERGPGSILPSFSVLLRRMGPRLRGDDALASLRIARHYINTTGNIALTS